MTTIWLQSVTVADVLRWLPSALSGRVLVRYDEHHASPAALRLLTRLSGRSFEAAHLDFNKLDEKGHGLLYRMQDDMLASMGRYVEETLSGEALWLRQAVHFLLRERLERPLIFLTSAQYAAASREGPHVFVIDADPADGPIMSLFASRGVTVHRRRRWGKALKPLLFPLKFAGAVVLARSTRGRKSGNATGDRPAVWSELMPPAPYDHAFWREAFKEREGCELVYYLDRPDTRPSPGTLGEIERQGFRWIDLHPVGLLRWADVSWGRWLRIAGECLSRAGLPFWLRITIFECLVWRETYEKTFTRFNVKLLVQHDDRGWKQAVQAEALGTAGGIMLGYHWSNLPLAMKDWFLNAQHVYFVWGSAAREAIEKKGNSCRHILPSGLWLDVDEQLPPEAAAVRARSRFTLCLFDSDVNYDLWQSPATLAQYYGRLLALASRHADWGILIKCKFEDFDRYESLLPGGRDLSGVVRTLRAEGRLAVLSPKLSPLTVARGADLSVCYVMNSAGIVVGLRGHRAVHWDCVGLRHPLLHVPGQKVFYPTLDGLEEAVVAAASGDVSVGDFEPWARLFDYFRDQRAAERVAGFIEDYLRLNSSCDAFTAAAGAAARYRERNNVTAEFDTASLGAAAD